MKRKQWQRRLLCFFLAVAVLLGGLLCCLPVRTGAIVPFGLVQSALASYVTSAGYKMYNDQGTGQDILGSLSELYETWLDSPAGAAASQWTLAHIAATEAVYTDTSGQIVIKKAAADVFQQFSDWIQTEYSVEVGSDSPTQVVQSSDGIYRYQGYTMITQTCDTYMRDANNNIVAYWLVGPVFGRGTGSGREFRLAVRSDANNSVQPYTFYLVNNGNAAFYWLKSPNFSSRPTVSWGYVTNGRFNVYGYAYSTQWSADQWNQMASTGFNFVWDSSPELVSATRPSPSEFTSSGGVAGLGVTLAQAVADVVGQAADDDAVVIGVGAGVGATAADIASLVAQGVKAQTLTPSVSITAEAVIDTPVQPYPDIEGLGLPTLGAALVSRFPFCVPWDFVDTLRILNADPIPPVFDVTLVPASVASRWGVSGNYTLHVDLTSPEFAKLFVALRWGTLVGFCLGLALLTKRLIWTA